MSLLTRLAGALACACAVTTAAVTTAVAAPDNFPDHAIRFIVPWNAGGSNDIAARELQQIIGEQQKITIVVENAPGATGAIGLGKVASAAPDGYVVGMGTSSTLAQIAQNLTPLRNEQFAHIARVSTDPLILLVPKDGPANLEAFLSHMKQNPGKVSIGTPGTNNLNHIFAEMTARAAGVGYVNVPYPGGSRVIADLAGKQIQAAVLKPSESKAQIDAGYVRPIGVFGNERLQVYPDVPTFKEKGYDVYPYGPLVQMAYVVAPAGVSPQIRQRLVDIFSKAIQSQKFKTFAEQNGFLVDDMKGQALDTEVQNVQTTLNSVASKVFKQQ